MKAKLAIILTALLLFTALMPVYTWGAQDAELENAIKSVKTFFEVPDNLKDFSYSANNNGDRKIWVLNWNSKEMDGGSISARVDSNGEVISYNYYKYIDRGEIKRLPKISKQEAQEIGEEIINRVNPGIFNNLKQYEQAVSSINDQTYHFSYVRTYNGIVFPANSVSVAINRQTGKLQSYNKEWNDDASFPTADKAISIEEAQEAFKKNLGLKLTYNLAVDKEDMKVYAVYVPVYNSNYYIDAFTGERVNLGSKYYSVYMDESGSLENLKVGDRGAGVVLSPEEIKAIDEVSNLLSQQEAEKIARDFELLELDEGFVVNSARLSPNWPSKKDYIWSLAFVKETKDIDITSAEEAEAAKMEYRLINVSIDAKTGEITAFYNDYRSDMNDKPKYDKETSKEAVEKVIKDLQPERFLEVEYEEPLVDEIVRSSEEEAPRSYTFRYVRKVNGVQFPDNGITATFDAVTGKVASFNLTWLSDVEFPSVENALTLEKAYERLFSELGLRLQYNIASNDSIPFKMPDIGSDGSKEIKLVYGINTDSGKPIRFDAFTGIVLDYDGNPYKEKKQVEYNDISGHYAEQEIRVLAESGIALEGPAFRPGEEINQKDFLLLVSQVIDSGYQFFGKTAVTNDTEIQDLYDLLMREGIVKQDEKNPEAPITREESVKFLIRALKYDKIADLSNIFNCTFNDKDEITPELIGYVVIANGLKIVNGHGDYFRPQDKLSRADAIIVIYNYLQV